jgi:hypothetical protein
MRAPVLPGLGPSTEQTAGVLLRVLSLGAGVQSTTLALMAAHGDIDPMPDCAIFADTRWEPEAVYEHLAWLRSPNVLPFPVHIVSAGNLRADIIAGARGDHWASIPAFTRNVTPAGTVVPVYAEDDENGEPVVEGTRTLAAERIGIGISLDEAARMKPSFEAWQINRWPLIERGMTRLDCLRWLERHGYPQPPKSACIGCPFHSDDHWRRMRDRDPDAWADAVSVDRAVRTGFRGIRGEVYLHRSAVPLDQADLSTASDRGQLDLWLDECEGMCGV